MAKPSLQIDNALPPRISDKMQQVIAGYQMLTNVKALVLPRFHSATLGQFAL
ncbi:hypothetical protein [Symbiopectobacterium purcellii]|uniref:hypothetical protein n=1 Tax=Symbiopectobacterium purcellii TaxID=2871826 RepID=UPI003F87DE56